MHGVGELTEKAPSPSRLEPAERSVLSGHAHACAAVSLMNVMSILKVCLLFLSFSKFKNTASILFVLKKSTLSFSSFSCL